MGHWGLGPSRASIETRSEVRSSKDQKTDSHLTCHMRVVVAGTQEAHKCAKVMLVMFARVWAHVVETFACQSVATAEAGFVCERIVRSAEPARMPLARRAVLVSKNLSGQFGGCLARGPQWKYSDHMWQLPEVQPQMPTGYVAPSESLGCLLRCYRMAEQMAAAFDAAVAVAVAAEAVVGAAVANYGRKRVMDMSFGDYVQTVEHLDIAERTRW